MLRLSCQSLCLQDVKGQYWTDDDSDGDNDSEEFLYGIQGSCAADLYRHPQLDVDIEAVKEIYSDTAVSVREYGTIDDVDIDLQINISFLDEVATAWKVIRTEPIILRLRFSLSQYLDGPEPSVEVFQPSNKDGFSLGLQLKKILSTFTSQQWKHLSNDFLKTQQEKRHSWFKAGGTIKKFRAGLSIFSPIPKSPSFPLMQDSALKGKLGVPELRVTRLMNRSISCTMKNPKGELFGYPTASQSAAVPAARPPPQITMKQLIELFFSSQAGGHCKNIPTLEYGFLVQIMKYAEQRIPTLNEYCVVCDEQHVFQNGSMLKPAVCTRELCVFSFYTLGVMSGAAEEVATGAEVVDLLVAMCRAALESPRKSIIFEPYPSVVDPNDPKTLAFNPKKKNYERLQKALDSVMSIREMTQGSYLEIKKQMDKLDPLAHPLLQWIISSNRSHIVKLPLSRQLKFMHTSHQFLLLSSPPAKEARFRTAKKLYGSTFAFHGSHIENWHSILRNGLVNASYTKLQVCSDKDSQLLHFDSNGCHVPPHCNGFCARPTGSPADVTQRFCSDSNGRHVPPRSCCLVCLAPGEYGVHWVLGYLLASLWQGWTTSCRGSSEFSPMGIFGGVKEAVQPLLSASAEACLAGDCQKGLYELACDGGHCDEFLLS
ncbi:protein mono-ADP-ribosyltransferase PARP6 isoform X2 [Erpetoichthys calabaricus]|uniref:protein mono-ADP-ribosyltransferase PARP6 isoform X2 n=1 Tax=Erpetoichthys calabaricus TaxID=27687 RepID=UPI002234360C|nr:protein mono-ADP-ribosyltransferase PARP6 isoform X2 [Erpetoichthys calabaricus]